MWLGTYTYSQADLDLSVQSVPTNFLIADLVQLSYAVLKNGPQMFYNTLGEPFIWLKVALGVSPVFFSFEPST